MKYLVTMKVVETKLPTSPQGMVQHLEQQVIPSHQACVKLEAEKKILAGGSQVGRRAEVFIVEMASNEELDQLLRSLPLWPMWEVDVIPLQSYEEVLSKERQLLECLK
jgi:muconolactone delta-isomerase